MPNRTAYVALFGGLFAVSTAATLVRLGQGEGVPSLVLAAGRLLVAVGVLTPFVLLQHRSELRKLNRVDWLLVVACGASLAIHFGTWITSLEHASVAASVVCLSTAPIFVSLLSYPFLGERVSRPVVLGTVVAFLGGIPVALGEVDNEMEAVTTSFLGLLLATTGAVSMAVYLILGRRFRQRLHVVPYIWIVYGIAAVLLSLACLVTGPRFDAFPAMGYVWLVALGLVPQLIGHSSMNYALGHLPAAYVSLTFRLEVVGSIIVSICVLNEWPSWMSVVGGVIILVGVALANQRVREKENARDGE